MTQDTKSAAFHLRIGWRAFQVHWRLLVSSTLVLVGSWVMLELSVIALHRLGVVVNVLLHLSFLCLAGGLIVGIHDLALRIIDGEVPASGRLFASLRRGPSHAAASCVYLVSVAVGLALFVVPGLYVAARYALFGQVLARTQASPLTALRIAGSLARGHVGAIARVLAALAALNLGGAALLGLGLLVTVPLSILAGSSLYRTLQAGGPSRAASATAANRSSAPAGSL